MAPKPNIRFNTKMAWPFTFNRDTSKMVDFVTAYNKIRIREMLVEKQV